LLWLAPAIFAAFLAHAANAQNSTVHADLPALNQEKQTIVFVCLHGSVNSQIAAAYFNRIAEERGLRFVAISRGIDVQRTIPVRILDNLALEGLSPANPPDELTSADANCASAVVAFDPVPSEQKGDAKITYWRDVPIGIDDFQAARDAILPRIEQIISNLPGN